VVGAKPTSSTNLKTIKNSKKMKKMKTLLMVLSMCLLSMISFGQNDNVYLIKEYDQMSGDSLIYINRSIVVANSTNTIGFIIDAYIRNDMTFGFITATMVGIGNCNRNDEIIILFDNNEKIIKKSWNDFNCKGETYFDLNENEINLLKTQTMSKIRMTNGETFDSYTGNVNQSDKKYFIHIFKAIDNGLIKIKKQ
jgi:hypothetical protein